jgi:pimeloyl-ACP methyl ester carboxylesterase
MGAIPDRLPPVSTSDSANDGNLAANALDGSLTTRWSANGDGQWIRFDLAAPTNVGSVKIAWYKGDQRKARFDIQTSATGTDWTTVFAGQSSGTTTGFESYDVTASAAQYMRIVGHGTSLDLWNSITEVEMYASSSGVDPGGSDGLRLNVGRPSESPDGLMIPLNWNGLAGATSQIQVSSNLVAWEDIGGAITNTGMVQTWQDDVASLPASARTVRFYRVKQKSASTSTNTQPPIEKALARLQIENGKMPYWRNRPLDVSDPRVTRAIIVIHGAGANAEGYFDRINNIIPSNLRDNVMVIAPYFQDLAAAPSGEYGWDGDWREGGDSGGISSYAVLDKFVETMRNGNFPNLKWVVVCGHSAGGQTTQRYAAFTDIDEKPWPNAQYLKFVPANPSSYVYLNEYRNPEGDSSWVVPAQDCSSGDGYNEWKYGLTGLYGYTAARGAEWARTHLPARQVELLAGTADTFDNGDLDLDCGAEWQGPFRYQRAHIFKMFMDKYYPANHFNITDVPGVDHDSTRMFASPQGMNALFFPD